MMRNANTAKYDLRYINIHYYKISFALSLSVGITKTCIFIPAIPAQVKQKNKSISHFVSTQTDGENKMYR